MSFLRYFLQNRIAILTLSAILIVLYPFIVVAASSYDYHKVFRTFEYIDAAQTGQFRDLDGMVVSEPIDIGFSFEYYGTSYSQVIIGAKGVVGFSGETNGLDNLTVPIAIPDSADPNTVIAPLSSDLDLSKGGSIYTNTGGFEGERFFVVEWQGLPVNGKGGIRTFELILYEKNDDIVFQYKTLRGGEEMSPSNTTIGLENQTGDNTSITIADLSQIQEGWSIVFSQSELTVDSDDDKILDRYEIFYGLDSNCGDDLDNGTNCQDADFNKDGQSDERPTGDTLTNLEEYQVGTLPGNSNSDADSDNENDSNEIMIAVNDSSEVGDPASPLDSDSNNVIDALEKDSDKDGMQDNIEHAHGLDQSLPDTDSDGYNDPMEITFGTDPGAASSTPSLGFKPVTGTIQSLIDDAATTSGDVLYIPSGQYVEDLVLNKAITLIAADPATTSLKGRITVNAANGSVIAGLSIANPDLVEPAIKILGHDTQMTKVTLVDLLLKNCVNGIEISDHADAGALSGADTQVFLDQVTYEVTEPMAAGFGIKVKGLQDAGDQVEISNASLSLTGPNGGEDGAIIVDNSQNVTVKWSSIFSAQGAGVQIADGTDIMIENNIIQGIFGHGIHVEGVSSGVLVKRNTLQANSSGSGIRISGSGDVTITDNSIIGNKEFGIDSSSTGTVSNTGNNVPDIGEAGENKMGAYNGTLDSETPSSEVGIDNLEKMFIESAAWIQKDKGGSVAVIDASGFSRSPTENIFGAHIEIGAGDLTQDTRVTLGILRDTASFPLLPVVGIARTPVIEVSLDNAEFQPNSAVTVVLPVITNYDPQIARIYQLINNTVWEEIAEANLTPLEHVIKPVETTLPQQISFQVFENEGSSNFIFRLVIDVPLNQKVDRDVGGGCAVLRSAGLPDNEDILFDVLLWGFALFFFAMKVRNFNSK